MPCRRSIARTTTQQAAASRPAPTLARPRPNRPHRRATRRARRLRRALPLVPPLERQDQLLDDLMRRVAAESRGPPCQSIGVVRGVRPMKSLLETRRSKVRFEGEPENVFRSELYWF